MKTYIYKSSKKEALYLYLVNKDDFSAVPQSLYESMGKQPVFVMELELSAEKKLARQDAITVMKNLQQQGFHVQLPPTTEQLGAVDLW